MRKKFMLIDDSEIDLFINKKYIEKLSMKTNVKSFTSAKVAFDYLSALNQPANRECMFFPDIILLDLNMPEMNGFQFLNKFSMLENNQLKKIKIFMLSSSINSYDKSRAEQQSSCKGFINKPLSSQKIEQIIDQIANELILE